MTTWELCVSSLTDLIRHAIKPTPSATTVRVTRSEVLMRTSRSARYILMQAPAAFNMPPAPSNSLRDAHELALEPAGQVRGLRQPGSGRQRGWSHRRHPGIQRRSGGGHRRGRGSRWRDRPGGRGSRSPQGNHPEAHPAGDSTRAPDPRRPWEAAGHPDLVSHWAAAACHADPPGPGGRGGRKVGDPARQPSAEGRDVRGQTTGRDLVRVRYNHPKSTCLYASSAAGTALGPQRGKSTGEPQDFADGTAGAGTGAHGRRQKFSADYGGGLRPDSGGSRQAAAGQP